MRHGYSYGSVLDRVRAQVRDRYGEIEERRHKAVYEDDRVRIARDQWKRKWSGDVKFTYEELDALAEFFDAPYGWPFLDWQYALSLREAAELLRAAAPAATADPPATPGDASPAPGRLGKRVTGGQ